MRSHIPFLLIMLAGFLLVLASGCTKDDNPSKKTDTSEFALQARAFLNEAGQDYDSTWVTIGGEDVLYYHYIIEENPGGPGQNQGNVLSVYYTIATLDGDTIVRWGDDTLSESPIVMGQGLNAVYPIGVDYAVSEMRDEETWGFIFPPELAYGEIELVPSFVPARSPIQFLIQLKEIRNTFDDISAEETLAIEGYIVDSELNDTSRWGGSYIQRFGELRYKLMDSSFAVYPRPVPGDCVEIAYDAYFLEDSAAFDRKRGAGAFRFLFGEDDIISGLEEGVSYMHLGGRSILMFPSTMGYQESAQIFPHNPDAFGSFYTQITNTIVPEYAVKAEPYEPLRFDVTLVRIY